MALAGISLSLGRWAVEFYRHFQVRVVTARGLTSPYGMIHGCGHRDSGGVGVYTALGVLRTLFHPGVLAAGAPARTLRRGEMTGYTAGLLLPIGGWLTEFCFMDYRRLVRGSRAGIARLLAVAVHGCAASGGCANSGKLMLFSIARRGRRMGYVTEAPIPTLIGEVPVKRRGLRLAGVPLVMGEAWPEPLLKCVRRLQLIRTGVVRLKPVYVLAVRIALGYAVSVLDFLFSSHRYPAALAARAQSALDAGQAWSASRPCPSLAPLPLVCRQLSPRLLPPPPCALFSC